MTEPTGRCPFTAPTPRPPPKPASLVKSLFQARRDLLPIFSEDIYRNLMGHIRAGMRDIFIVNSPSVIRDVLQTDADNYPKSRQMYRALTPLVGDGIFISNGPVWRRRRRMVSPSLENVRLRVAFPVMKAAVDDMLARLFSVEPSATLNLDAEMAHVTADIIFRTIFSRPLTQAVSRDVFDAFSEYQAALPQFSIVEMLGLPDWVPRRLSRKTRSAGQRIRQVLRAMIEERRQSDLADQQDILQALMQARDEQGRGFGLEELVDEVAVLFLAGHETSATALTWAVYLAGKRPDIEDRLVAEAEAVLAEPSLRFEHVNRLRLSRNVFREALRLYPPVSFLTREPIADRKVGRRCFRKGAMIVVSPWLLHRHRRFWAEPDCFDPDRFDQAATKNSEKEAYLPFGMGQRACPGAAFAMLEGPLIISSMLRNFRFELVEGIDVRPVCRLTTRPVNKLSYRIRPRRTET